MKKILNKNIKKDKNYQKLLKSICNIIDSYKNSKGGVLNGRNK